MLSLQVSSVFSQDAVIAVGEAEQDLDKIVVDDSEIVEEKNDLKKLANEVTEIIRNDFLFYKHKFQVLNFEEKVLTSFSNPQFENWASKSYAYVISSQAQRKFGSFEMIFKIYSVTSKEEILKKTFIVNPNSLRSHSHEIANILYQKITGKFSIFTSKIAFLSDRTSSKETFKELYLMDFDGRSVEKLTNFNSIVLSPSFSPDNSKLMFSVIATHSIKQGRKTKLVKNIDLKLMNIETRKLRTLSSRPGINSGAIFSGTEEKIYLTLSYSGNADIYEMNLSNEKLKKITSHYADDVDPSITKDGTLMSFLSNRAGRAHIYTMDPAATEKNIKRISFVGQFNATPRFSPDGKEIVFTSWVDNSFDLYRINSDGNNLSRLTKDFGSNEEPVYSPDGEFIVFTSKRVISSKRAVQDIYIMNRNGDILGQLTKDFGSCFSPVWTNYLN